MEFAHSASRKCEIPELFPDRSKPVNMQRKRLIGFFKLDMRFIIRLKQQKIKSDCVKTVIKKYGSKHVGG
jgi:hypothetical protein